MDDDLLPNVPPAPRQQLLGACSPRSFQRGATLFHEGDPGESLHIVVSGRLAVRVTTGEGASAALNIVGPGDIIGEMALIRPGAERSASVVALEPCRTLMLTHSAFTQLCKEHPILERTMSALLADRVEQLIQYLKEALYLSADRRIARRIVEVSALYGGCLVGTIIPLTQQDLAGIAGTTRPTVNQVLRKLETQGALAVFRGGIEVKDPRLLRLRAGP